MIPEEIKISLMILNTLLRNSIKFDDQTLAQLKGIVKLPMHLPKDKCHNLS